MARADRTLHQRSRVPSASRRMSDHCGVTVHWRDQKTETQGYLQKMAGVFKTASGGTVEFPYVVVVTLTNS